MRNKSNNKNCNHAKCIHKQELQSFLLSKSPSSKQAFEFPALNMQSKEREPSLEDVILDASSLALTDK